MPVLELPPWNRPHTVTEPPSAKRWKWNPSTVSWIGFLLFSLIVSAIGLLGSSQIAALLEEEMVLHGADHNRAVFRRVLPQIQALIADSTDARRVLADFPAQFAAAETLSMSIFLVDRPSDRIIAHSEQAMPAEGLPLAPLLEDVPAWMRLLPGEADDAGRAMAATSLHQTPVLLYRAALFPASTGADATPPDYARDWDLVVETEMADVAGTTAAMHRRVQLLLLTTDLLIILFGFFALRHVGRQYERTLEQQLAARSAELEDSHAEVLRQTTLATIGRTTSVLAHEMRNPLAAIKLSLSSLDRADYLSERDRRRVALVLRETDRLDELLSDTLDHVRPIKRSPQPLPLYPIVQRVVELLTPVAHERDISLHHGDCPQCPPLRVDADQLQQALLNLVKNAIEAAPDGTGVSIVCTDYQQGWRLSVSNPGTTISSADQARLFDAFFTTKPKGTGLGLFLVKRVLAEHGGSVSVHSDAEHGTTMTLTLPPQ